MARGKGRNSKSVCDLGDEKCLEPSGKDIVWVYCEPCSKWFHCKCVQVDAKRASDDDFIFHCQICKPAKKREFDAIKASLANKVEAIMKAYPIFATPIIARKYFATKALANEYHVRDPEVPTTLRALSERISKKVESLDHFKYLTEAFVARLNEFLKPDVSPQVKEMEYKMEQMIDGFVSSCTNSGSEINEESSTKAALGSKPRRGGKVQQKNEDGNKENDEIAKKKEAEAVPVKNCSTGKTGKGEKGPKAALGQEVKLKCSSCKSASTPPLYQCLDLHITCDACFQKSTRCYCPACRRDASRNRKTKKHETLDTVIKPEDNEAEDVVAPEQNAKKETSERKLAVKGEGKSDGPKKAKEPLTSDKKGGITSDEESTNTKIKRKSLMKAKTEDAKRPKLNEAKSARTEIKANLNEKAKKSLGSPDKQGSGSLLTNVSLPSSPKEEVGGGGGGNKILNIASLLPTAPNPRMQAIRPGQQLIQVRPGTVQIRPAGLTSSTGNMVQVRPAGAATLGHMSPSPAVGPQFFKIVGGKPIQLSGISGGNGGINKAATVLSTISGRSSASPIQSATGQRVVYLRKPAPASTTPSSILSSGSSSASPSKLQGKIILVSNKNQVPGRTAKFEQTIAPSGSGVVKLVAGPSGAVGTNATNISSLASGILSTLKPVAVNTSTGSQVGNVRGPPPVLLRTVAPKGSKTSRNTSLLAPQLPSEPIPKSKLDDTRINSSVTAATTTTTNPGLDSRVQAMLPKRPIKPQTESTGRPAKILKKVSADSQLLTDEVDLDHPATFLMPSNVLPGGNLLPAKQQITTISGPFVWKNSSQTNFKLSSRINFASFAKFKEVSDANDKDAEENEGEVKKAKDDGIHFTLATIVTDDDSNEFAFKLNLKTDEKDGKSFLELEARSRKPHNQHNWNLKVKTDPPTVLVSGGCFANDDTGIDEGVKNACAFRVPKRISDLKFVDYELQIDKVPSVQQAEPNQASKTGAITRTRTKSKQ